MGVTHLVVTCYDIVERPLQSTSAGDSQCGQVFVFCRKMSKNIILEKISSSALARIARSPRPNQVRRRARRRTWAVRARMAILTAAKIEALSVGVLNAQYFVSCRSGRYTDRSSFCSKDVAESISELYSETTT